MGSVTMAGSYNHVVTEDGNLRSPEMVNRMLENGGDVFEAIEQMYGMIWWLAWHAHLALDGASRSPDDHVERARQNYAKGLEIAKRTHKRKHKS
jgi:hypothetical protein